MDLSMADVLWTGNPGEAAGSVVQAADLDLDGYPELLVGTAASSRLYVLPGPLFASGLLEESGARVEGSGGLGTAVADFGVHGGRTLWGAGAPGADVDGGRGAARLRLLVRARHERLPFALSERAAAHQSDRRAHLRHS